MDLSHLIAECTGFDWDEFNVHKNWDKHQVSWWECEEIFNNEPLLLLDDFKHSEKESRFLALGKTIDDRLLFVSFTFRRQKIRPISARGMSRKERKLYGESKIETDSQI